MSAISQYLRSDHQAVELLEILQLPVNALLGVSAEASTALTNIGIDTVFDLGASWIFDNASATTEVGQLNGLAGSLGLTSSNLLKSSAQFENAVEIPELALEFLDGLSDDQATAISSALDVFTIRDFAQWPPRLAAHKMVSDAAGTTTLEEDQGEVLRPRLGEYPTERVYYKSLTMLQFADEAPRGPIEGPISLIPAVNQHVGFGKPAVGALLTYSQSWHARGVTLGHMLHSLALAPGEATRIAVVDWSRRTSATTSESIAETEQLDSATDHVRAISEVQNAVAEELQEGESQSSGWAHSSSSSEADASSSGWLSGVLGAGGGSDSEGSQESTSRSAAVSTSWSQGSRSISAEMSQNVNDRTEQHANSVRNRRATAVREVSQSEHEAVSTRIVANYNHMHALTIQYYEVVQVYQVAAQLHQAHRCIFVPFELLDFGAQDSMDIVNRFRGSLVRSALTPRIRDLLIDSTTMVAITPARRSGFVRRDFNESLDSATVLASAEAGRDDPADAKTATHAGGTHIDFRSAVASHNRDAILRIASVIKRSPLRPGSKDIHLPDETELLGISFDGLDVSTVRIDRPGVSVEANTFSVMGNEGRIDVPSGVRLSEIEDINVGKTEGAAATGYMQLHCAYRGRAFTSESMFLDLREGTAPQKVATLQTDESDRQRELVAHLQENRTHYSQAIFRSLDSATVVMLLSPFTWNGKALVDQVEPHPVSVAGNYLVFRAPIEQDESSGVMEDGDNLAWGDVLKKHGIDFGVSNGRLIPIPTAGVFAEAVLGRSNSAEKLDITRFWNWKDSPIPLEPPEIAPVGLGSRATAENLTPGQLSSPVLNIVNPTSLPDPAGLSASLGALANANLFRDMSGLAGTQSLTESAIRETLAAAGQAGQLASTNLQTEAQKQVAFGQIAADIAKAAMGIPPTGSTDGISADGARINHGRDLDERGLSGGMAGGGGGSGASGSASGSSGGRDSTKPGSGNATMASPLSSREAAFADQGALGFSPGGLGALSRLVTDGILQPASLTVPNGEGLQRLLGDIRSALELEFTPEDVGGLQVRRQMLRELFGKVPPGSADQLGARLGDEPTQDELSQLFHSRLATPTRVEMLAILEEVAKEVVAEGVAPVPRAPLVFPSRPLPPSFDTQLDAVLTELEAVLNAGSDSRKTRLLCWINKLRDPSADDRMIEWETICDRVSHAASPFSTACLVKGIFTTEQDMKKHIHNMQDVESANSKLKFMTHVKSQLVMTNQFADGPSQLNSLKTMHDEITKTVHVLENMATNHPISGGAAPDYYLAIRAWIKGQQANTRSPYSCM